MNSPASLSIWSRRRLIGKSGAPSLVRAMGSIAIMLLLGGSVFAAPPPGNQNGGNSCKEPPPITAFTEYSDVVYATVPRGDGQGTFGLMLDVHVPTPGGKYPALIYLHGGGWVSGSRTGADGNGGSEPFVQYFAAEGPFVVFNVDYRMPCDPANPGLEYFDGTPHLSPRAAICSQATHIHPVPLADVRAAIAWVKRNGARYGADVQKIGIVGDSAGGHLAILAATYDGVAPLATAKPRAAAGFSPPANFELAGEAELSNDHTPDPPVPLSSSPDGSEFDQCAYLAYESWLGEYAWTNYGTNCAAVSNRAVLVGQGYQEGNSPEQIASRNAWRQASPHYWVGSTNRFNPDTPCYIIGGDGEGIFLEQEGLIFMNAAANVSAMAGSYFCELSAGNTLDVHGSNLAGYPIEPGCYGYDPNASTQISVLRSSLLFLRKNISSCP